MTCPPCTGDCNQGRDCPALAGTVINLGPGERVLWRDGRCIAIVRERPAVKPGAFIVRCAIIILSCWAVLTAFALAVTGGE